MDNLRGIFFMTLAMAGFALEDLIIKMLSDFMLINIPSRKIIIPTMKSGDSSH